jgi:hypothetical protein
MSKLGTLVSDFKTGAEDVKAFILKVAGDAPAIVQTVAKDAALLTPVLEAFVPQSTTAIALSNTLLDQVGQAVEDAGPAAGANGLSVTLDQTVVADVKAVIAAAKAAIAKV